MRLLTTTTALDTFVGGYGPNDERSVWGVLSDHVDLFVRAGGVVRNAASGSGAQWALVDGKAYPVVCSAIVEVWTEDGPMVGRCGSRIARHNACEGHAQERDSYLSMSEAERTFAERARDLDFSL